MTIRKQLPPAYKILERAEEMQEFLVGVDSRWVVLPLLLLPGTNCLVMTGCYRRATKQRNEVDGDAKDEEEEEKEEEEQEEVDDEAENKQDAG